MRHDFFFRTETNARPWVEQCTAPAKVLLLDLPDGLTITAMLAAAHEAGMPRGSNRSGCFEIQNDRGIWQSKCNNRLTERNASFTPWNLVT